MEPVRSCAGCRSRHPQRRLVRVVRLPDGSISVDDVTSGQRPAGRGAYVCPDAKCIETALKGGLRRTLKHDGVLPDDLEERLLREARRKGGLEPETNQD